MCAAAPQGGFNFQLCCQHYFAPKRGVHAAYAGGARIGRAAGCDERRQHFVTAPILPERIIGGAHWGL
jgi:hypothetical protein